MPEKVFVTEEAVAHLVTEVVFCIVEDVMIEFSMSWEAASALLNKMEAKGVVDRYVTELEDETIVHYQIAS